MRFEFFGVFVFLFCLGLVSAGFVDDVFAGVTGNVVLGGEEIECYNAKSVFQENYSDYEIPEGIPFSDDVFDVYVDEDFFVSLELVDKKLVAIECDVSDEVSYSVYVRSSLIDSITSGELDEDVVGFYNDKKKSGEIKIEAAGFGKRLKLGFINFGLKIAGWFS